MPYVQVNGEWVQLEEKPVELVSFAPKEEPREAKKRGRKPGSGRGPKQSDLPRVCGMYNNICYSGIMEVNMTFGTCDSYNESGRLAVKHNMEACPLWRPKSKSRIEAEKRTSQSMIESLFKNKRR